MLINIRNRLFVQRTWSTYKLNPIRFLTNKFFSSINMEEDKETTQEISCLTAKVSNFEERAKITKLTLGDQEVG
jgi:hypothetical protein